MTSERLTIGALSRYLHGYTSEKAIVQVLGIKIINSITDKSSESLKHYRLFLSDSQNTYSSCMLAVHLNHLIEQKLLKTNSIIRIDRVSLKIIDKESGRIILMLNDIEVLQSNCQCIGNPVPLPLNDIINTNQTDFPKLPRLNSNGIDKDRIIDINTLNPFVTKWTIKVRIGNKTPIRTFENARGQGKIFSCDLVDQSGAIRATAFNSECEKFYPILQVGKVFYIAKATLKPANRQFNTTKNEYEMTLNPDTIVEPCSTIDEHNIPQVQYDFIPINLVTTRPVNSICDVIGVIKSTADIQTVTGRTTAKEFVKRDLVLIDEKASIIISLWGQQAELFNGSTHPVVAFKGIRISDYRGRSLSCLNTTLIRENPSETERTNELTNWFDNGGKSMDLIDLSKGIENSNRTKSLTRMKTFAQIVSEGIGSTDKPEYVMVKAICTSIKKDSVVYQMCPQDRCGKKLVEENDGTYRCDKCDQHYDNFKWAFMVTAEITDATGSQWITLFREEAEALIGTTPSIFGEYKSNQNDDMLDSILRQATNRERLFRLRIKLEQYNDERKPRYICMSISEIDWIFYGKHLLTEISSLTSKTIS